MADLWPEFAIAVHRLHDDHHVEEVVALGVPRSAMFGNRPYLGIARIVVGDAFFDFAEDGELAWIVPVGEPYPIAWEWLDDIVAFFPSDPSHWWLRRGSAEILGLDQVEMARWLGEPLILRRTPLDWLRAGMKGAVILDRNLDPRSTFYDIAEIRVADDSIGQAIEQRLADLARPDFRIVPMEVPDGA